MSLIWKDGKQISQDYERPLNVGIHTYVGMKVRHSNSTVPSNEDGLLENIPLGNTINFRSMQHFICEFEVHLCKYKKNINLMYIPTVGYWLSCRLYMCMYAHTLATWRLADFVKTMCKMWSNTFFGKINIYLYLWKIAKILANFEKNSQNFGASKFC
jgi:hypothetical protein